MIITKRGIAVFWASGLLALNLNAEIRTHQPSQKVSSEEVILEEGYRAEAEKQNQWRKEVQAGYDKTAQIQRNANTVEGLIVLLQPESYTAEVVRALNELLKDEEIKKLNPQLLLADRGMEGFAAMFAEWAPQGEDVPEFSIDSNNEVAQAFGITSEPTIVYRDATGAVRLYNLRNELDTLRRQLAREQKAAQPAR